MSSAPTNREEILSRVREALRTPTVHRPPAVEAPAAGYSDWLPPGGDSHEERVALFGEVSEKLKTRFARVKDAAAARELVAAIAAEENWRRVATHGEGLARQAAGATGAEVLPVDAGYDAKELETCDAGVTQCDALVAQTGSVLVTSRSAGGRALSVLPPHHVALATAEQLISDLPAAFELLRSRYAGDWPSFVSLITGPSRTGDIERILVLGAHGPKKLTVVLIEEEP